MFLLINAGDNKYYQDRHYDVSWVWDSISPYIILGTYDHELYGCSNSLSGIWHMFLDR